MKKINLVICAFLMSVVACTGSSGTTGGGGSDKRIGECESSSPCVTKTVNSELPPPAAVADLLDSVCGTADDQALVLDLTINGKEFKYTETLVQEDEGSTLTDGTSLWADNPYVVLHVEPSDDDNVYWAARKWVFAESEEKATDGLDDLTITSKTASGEAQVLANYLKDGSATTLTISGGSVTGGSTYSYISGTYNDTYTESGTAKLKPGISYGVCLVVKAPAAWMHTLTSDAGIIETFNHAGDLTASTNSGDLGIIEHAAGTVSASSDSGYVEISTTSEVGDVTVDQNSGALLVDYQGAGTLGVTNDSGSVEITTGTTAGALTVGQNSGSADINYQGSADLSVTNESGSISVGAASLTSVTIVSDSGAVDFTLSGEGAALEENSSITTDSGSIDVSLSAHVDLNLDVAADSGSVSSPNFSDNFTETLNTGGATLTVRANSGSIDINY